MRRAKGRQFWRGVLVLGPFLTVTAASPPARPDEPEAWPLACRLSCYGPYQDAGWAHLGTIGVRHVFLPVPAPGEVAALRKRLAQNHLTPLVFRGQTDLGKPDCVEELAVQLATCEAMGVHYLFLSPKHTGVDKATACDRLRRAGDVAKRHGVVITLETHPDLGTNAAAHIKTMKRIDHPNVRVNFDTGNITYYNPGGDAVAELARVIDYVGTVELKDHDGVPQGWNFPALGRGKVDFAGVVRVLKDHGYRGPITIEVEGVRGQTWNEEQTKQVIAESVNYLRRLATFR